MASRRILVIWLMAALGGCKQSPPTPSSQPQPKSTAADPFNVEYQDLMAMLKGNRLSPESTEMKVGDALQYISEATEGQVQIDLDYLVEAGANLDKVIPVNDQMTLADLLDNAIRIMSSEDLQIGYEIVATAQVSVRRELPNRPNRIPTTPFNDEQAKADQVNRITATPDPRDPTKVYIPSDLDDCFMELNRMLHPKLVEKMKTHSEDDMNDYHFGLGMWLRNNWGLWSEGGSHLSHYFDKMGISHPDDMSGIILNSFHRHLNGRPLKLNEQIAFYQAYWKKQREQQARGTQDSPTSAPTEAPSSVTRPADGPMEEPESDSNLEKNGG